MYPSATSYKIGPGGPKRHAGTPREVLGYANAVAQQRKRLGPDGAAMLDVHCALPPAMLIQLAAAIEPYDVLWIEEPAVPGNIEVFKRLKQAINIPLASGDTVADVGQVAKHGGVDRRTDRTHAGVAQDEMAGAGMNAAEYVPCQRVRHRYVVRVAEDRMPWPGLTYGRTGSVVIIEGRIPPRSFTHVAGLIRGA